MAITKKRTERGEAAPILLILLALVLVFGFVFVALKSHDVRHRAKVVLTKKHHIVMHDDQGKWYEYILNNTDVFQDVGRNAKGEFQLPRGGSWRVSKPPSEEEDEAVAEEETTIDETAEGEPDGAGDIGGDEGGADGGGDAGGGDGGDGD
jgi:hypothetical protein